MNISSEVEYLSSREGYSCGYCKSSNTNFSNGMWAHVLSVSDYQNLIDRGWRRSGMYCYKPTMKVTCCPLYTIKCEAVNLKLSKSQKKNLKKMTKFLKDGIKEKGEDSTNGSNSTEELEGVNVSDAAILERVVDKFNKGDMKIKHIDPSVYNRVSDVASNLTSRVATSETSSACLESPKSNDPTTISAAATSETTSTKIECQQSKEESVTHSLKETARLKTPRAGDGMDPSKPQCKKAKILRLERRQNKIQQQKNSSSVDVKQSNSQPKEKTLEDFIKESTESNCTNSLEMRLVPANSDAATLKTSWRVYVKYQMAIHKETENECSYRIFKDFLVASPLQPFKDENSPPPGYGSFHHQYWLNGKLIAVGVIDILPKCISSVYFFYDPDYSFLSLGTYGSLRELELVRSYSKKCPDLKNYYMGFYIHSCPKMKYKARLTPSYLLCPEVYTWHNVESCLPKLDVAKYSRLNEDKNAIDEDGSSISLNQVLVFCNNTVMTYGMCQSRSRRKDEEEVREFAELVGKKLLPHTLLFRE